ncbi:MAG TPA: PQQ-binding-like beta-propeller repeat protein [Candidatus Dormibacteraeota bacterium]|nr:PQQ-binding-like beta-propeller repeat protein [Candidatus Dormibacteraeota bacterium]
MIPKGLGRAVFIGLSLSALLARANDWPQWRGPNRDDISTETGLLEDWPAGGPKLAWKVSGIGDGFSGVAVAAGRLYTIGDQRGASFVFCLNAADGKILWAAKLGKAGALGGYGGPRSTPTVDGQLLYAVSQFGEMACFDTATAKEQWRKEFTRDLGGTQPGWGYAESPLVDGDVVVVTPGGKQGALAALKKETGAIIWRSKEFTDAAQYSSLVPAELGAVKQYVQLTAASVAGISAADGRLLWSAPRRGQTAVIPTPLVHDSFVYVTSGYGVGCNLFQVTPQNGKFSVKEVYANKAIVNHHGGVVLVGDCVYGFSDSKGWTCQDFRSGQVYWQDKEKLGKGSLSCAGDRLYLREESKPGTVVLLEPTKAGYKEHGRFAPAYHSEEQSWTHPVVANGRLYLRDQDVLMCYQVKQD